MSVDYQYPTQSTDWIASLPVQEICNPDCALFLWATNPLLPDALRVMEAWGFKYKTVAFCWSKRTVTGKRTVNLGRWTMGNVEICLLGTRGKPKRIKMNVQQYVEALRIRHSQKPDEVADRIVELMGDVPRIELFARQQRSGWSVWGNEVDSSIVFPSASHTALVETAN